MAERGHDRDTLQCRVKVKELRNAYHKAREANCRSCAAFMSCRFYKELDAIFNGNPTSNVKATVATSMAHVSVKSGPSQEEEISDADVEWEGGPEAEEDLEVRDACSRELFSILGEASQSQLLERGEVQIAEEVPDMTVGAQPPSLLSPAEQLSRIRRWP
ncbi:zinc finger protein with KRAB and SCAN domains 2-like [Gopherus evgoodei]|uniref:zinc finger protein with KRAB and SCAN domains 2-like n=1 Tax=Gopherus evgoodei TaxID=1825980 RepID=UPI0011D014E8|nr:zinc finger protein with KRAB and SCAN domains 2-like [Gopherus evgoodei]